MDARIEPFLWLLKLQTDHGRSSSSRTCQPSASTWYWKLREFVGLAQGMQRKVEGLSVSQPGADEFRNLRREKAEPGIGISTASSKFSLPYPQDPKASSSSNC